MFAYNGLSTLILAILIAEKISLIDADRATTSAFRHESLTARQRDDHSYLRSDENDADSRSLWESESNENSLIITPSDIVTSAASPQAVLCDIAKSIPALLSLKTNTWKCPAAGNATYCSWQGVICDPMNNILRLSILSASLGSTLRSTIPASLGTLITLKSLTIKQCSLRGSIPSSLSALTNLTQLILSSNFLTGSLPSGLSSLVSLQTLYIDNNTFSGTFPTAIASLSNLLYLDISLNKFYGKFPTFYGMPTVTVKTMNLNSYSSGISGTRIRSDFGYPELTRDNSIVEIEEQIIPSFETVYDEMSKHGFDEEFAENDFPGIVNGYESLMKENEEIERMEIENMEFKNSYTNEINNENNNENNSKNEIESEAERELKSLQSYYSAPLYYVPTPIVSTGLKYLSIYANFFTGTLPIGISGISSLIKLHISYNSLTGTIPSSLGNILTLESCSLQWNSFSGTIPSSLGMLKNLQTLKMFTNSLSGTIPSALGSLERVQTLILKYNFLVGKIPTNFGNLKKITLLDLSFNSLTGPIPSSLSLLNATLSNLYLKSNLLTNTIPSSLGSLKSLTRLGLNENHLTGTIPTSLGQLTKISLLYLSVNKLVGSIPSVIGNLINLQQLSLRQNRLTSTIPTTISKLTKIAFLQLFENKLTGTMPYQLSALSKLNTLYVQNNMLSGSIPSQYGYISTLTAINLASNKLTGTVPTTISNLKLLTVIHLGFNQLVGQIHSLQLLLLAIPQLVVMEISNNKFSGKFMDEIFKTRSLNILNVAGNRISGKLPESSWTFPNLLSLNISNNMMTGMVPEKLFNLSSLSIIDISNNDFTGSLGNFMCDLKALTTVYFAGNNFTCYASCLPPPSDNHTLISKPIKHCHGPQDDVICGIIKRTDVHLAVTRSSTYTPVTVQNAIHPYFASALDYITVSVPKAIEYTIQFDALTMTELFQDIVLFCESISCAKVYGSKSGYSGLSGSSWPGLGGTPQLVIDAPSFVVRFTSNGKNQFWGYKFTALARSAPGAGWACDNTGYATGLCDTIPWAGVTCSGPQVVQLDLSSLGISGSLPDTIGTLSNLIRLDLHFNFIGGTLPRSIGTLSNLQFLDLSGNKFTGTIPSIFGSLSHAWKLSLSSNLLTGTIPTSLAKLEQIKYFLLASNRFEGVLGQELCEISGANIDISGNKISCYESECWQKNFRNTTMYYNFGSLKFCSPTGQPTSTPTQPSSMPSSRPSRVIIHTENPDNTKNLSAIIAAVVVSCVSVLVCALFGFILWYKWRQEEESRKLRKERVRRMSNLPIHRAICEGMNADVLLSHLATYKAEYESAKEKDFDGRTAFDIAVETDTDTRIVAALLLNSLPYNCVTAEPLPASNHGFAWAKVVELDKYESAVMAVLDKFPSIVPKLAKSSDQHGRQVIDIASPKCKRAILQMIYIYRRYELTSPLGKPIHNSHSCLVHSAIDHEDDDRLVALKFMRHRDHFTREVRARTIGCFSEDYVAALIRTHDGDDDEAFGEEMIKKGFVGYSYCLVLELGETTLGGIIANEQVLIKDWETIRLQALQVAKAVEHLHSKGFIHGDIKPLNVMRINHKLKLIDLDACVSYSNCEEHSCTKYSSAYVPPELLYATSTGVVVRCPTAKWNTANASRRNSNSNTPLASTLNSALNTTSFPLHAISENSIISSPSASEEEREREKEMEKEREREIEMEKEREREIEMEKESEREIEMEKEREREIEKEREKEEERENGIGMGVGTGTDVGSDCTPCIPGLKMSRDRGGGRGICKQWSNYDDEESKDSEMNRVKRAETGNTNSVRVIIESIDNYNKKMTGETTEIGGHSVSVDGQECHTAPTSKRGSISQLPPNRFSRMQLQRCSFNKLINEDSTPDTDFDLVLASPSFDLWSMGALFFDMSVGAPLFHSDRDGNALGTSELRVISAWTDEVKLSKMLCVDNLSLRNLISQLLVKDPTRRPDIKHVLAHPFLTGKIATRMAGESAEFDVFLSYRVDADAVIVEELYRKLLAGGVSVWFDKMCLKPGEPWEDGFCRGMAMSRIFVPLISRESVKSRLKSRNNFESLKESSSCDNVLLEHRLALELKERGLMEKIFPIFIGDVESADPGSVTKYDFAGPESCHPNCPEIVVGNVELKTREHLDKQGMGLPLLDELTVSEILSGITRYQGAFLCGKVESSLSSLMELIIEMVQEGATL